jgi:hypothetical protein
MKKILLFFISFFFLISSTNAYTPTDGDIKSVNNIKEYLWDISYIK